MLEPYVKEGIGWAVMSWMSVSMSLVVWHRDSSAVTFGKGTLCGNQSMVNVLQTPKVLGI